MTTSRDAGRVTGRRGVTRDGPPVAASIVLNGEDRAVEPGLSVAELLHSLGLEPGMVVVERNREILARRELAGTPVEDGDRFELVHFVGGG
ncbi:MAG: sulfur carrier protein ThiS [Gemmatimonadota bacterium]|nr:sulfur carrier protein ThiS [Gemmatimonadota bacterium]MDE2676480.1 sulfur carrier protein ThiS [Gemmatimonadota bacterium]